MKKVLFASLAVLAVMFTSCTTMNYEYQESGSTLSVTQLAVKDYDIVGPCKVEVTLTEKQDLFNVKKDGSEVVYPLLLDKAIELGGQDVINVRVSKKEESTTTLYGIFGKEATYTYTATALVIKYNNKNLQTVATYDKDGKLTNVTGPVIESSKGISSAVGSNGGFFKKIINKIFKK